MVETPEKTSEVKRPEADKIQLWVELCRDGIIEEEELISSVMELGGL